MRWNGSRTMRCCSMSCPPGRRMASDRLQPGGAARTVRRSAAAGAFLRPAEQRALPHLAAGLAQADGCARHALRAGAGRARGGRRRVAGGRRRLERRVGARCVGRPPSAARQPGGAVAGGARRPMVGADAAFTAHYPHRDAAGAAAAGYRASADRTATPPGAGLDFLSVSFGYTEPLWRFWQSCGFELVRIGSKPEASSGCYTAMAILPLSEQGRRCGTRRTSIWRATGLVAAAHRARAGDPGRRRRYVARRRGLA